MGRERAREREREETDQIEDFFNRTQRQSINYKIHVYRTLFAVAVVHAVLPFVRTQTQIHHNIHGILWNSYTHTHTVTHTHTHVLEYQKQAQNYYHPRKNQHVAIGRNKRKLYPIKIRWRMTKNTMDDVKDDVPV